MKKVWKAVMAIVLVALVLGAICFGVGLLTGAELDRIYSVLDNRFNITAVYKAYSQYVKDLTTAIQAVLV